MELEFSNQSSGNAVAHALYDAGLTMSNRQHVYHCTCDQCRYDFGAGGNWLKVQNDSSCGGEVISSILRWGWTGSDASTREPNPWFLMQELERVMGLELDVPMDQNCGMHVHVGARDLSARQLGRLYELTEHHEATLFRLACGRQARHRGYRNNFSYCRPLSAFKNPMELKALEKAKTAAVIDSAIAKQKYVAANLMPLSSLGTVEFRLFEATRSARRMRLFTKLSVALVERAKRPRTPMGKPLSLGETGDDGTLEVFLEDLEHGAGASFINDEFKTDAHWQWELSPAGWQEYIELSPLPHYDANHRPTNNPDRAVYCSDGHGNNIQLEGDEVPPPYSYSVADSADNERPEFYDEDLEGAVENLETIAREAQGSRPRWLSDREITSANAALLARIRARREIGNL